MFPDRLLDSFQHLLFPSRFLKLDERMRRALARLAAEEEQSRDELGQKMLRFALNHRRAASRQLETWKTLTPREKEVTALTCLGCTNKEIARQLVIAPATVKTHLRNAKHKFGLRSKLELRNALADWDFSDWES
ncbi:MAG: helix-turn-helix transcriptional regulator [Anaerolineales bacterium]|nr:helix-turn-helix transcriptional regulator [Anaerolineales bacterium]